jgi:cell wall-associated NlpC family hydrolase
VFGLLVVTGALLASPLTASAAPRPQTPNPPTTSAQVMTTLTQLAKSNDILTERYNLAKIQVAKAQKAAAQAAQDAAAAQVALAAARQSLAASLASQYRSSSFSRTAALLGSDSGQSYLDKMQSLNFLSLHDKEVAITAGQATATAQQAQRAATAAVASAQAQQDQVTQQVASLTAEIAKQKALFASLSAAERARFLAAGTPKTPKVVTQSTSPTASAPTASNTPVVTGKGGAAAVQAAMSQLGKPYSWGAAGPDSYDCSGLTMWAWAHAGVSLPHQSAEQQGYGTPVSVGQLQPGDLVFFGSPAYHVGIYIGNGQMVHAPTTGDVVKVTSLSYMSDYSGAVHLG